jgi:hypothetical protein
MPWLMISAEGCCQRLENASGAIWRAGTWKGKGKYFLIPRGGVAIYAAKRVAVSSQKVSKR